MQYLFKHIKNKLRITVFSAISTEHNSTFFFSNYQTEDTLTLYFQEKNNQHTLSSIAYFYCLKHISMNDGYVAFKLSIVKASLEQKFYLRIKNKQVNINNLTIIYYHKQFSRCNFLPA